MVQATTVFTQIQTVVNVRSAPLGPTITETLQHPVLPAHQDRQPYRKEAQAAHSVPQVRNFKIFIKNAKYPGI